MPLPRYSVVRGFEHGGLLCDLVCSRRLLRFVQLRHGRDGRFAEIERRRDKSGLDQSRGLRQDRPSCDFYDVNGSGDLVGTLLPVFVAVQPGTERLRTRQPPADADFFRDRSRSFGLCAQSAASGTEEKRLDLFSPTDSGE